MLGLPKQSNQQKRQPATICVGLPNRTHMASQPPVIQSGQPVRCLSQRMGQGYVSASNTFVAHLWGQIPLMLWGIIEGFLTFVYDFGPRRLSLELEAAFR
jgi:hypothetical protein